MLNCRANGCTMPFKSEWTRKQHEEMFHKDMYEKAVSQIIKHINLTNSENDLKKKIVYTGEKKLSYSEIAELDVESSEYRQVQSVLSKFVQDWLSKNPESNVDDFFRRAKFKILG